MKIGDYKQMMAYLTRPEQPKEQVAYLVDELEPGPLKDELTKDYDPSQETYEEYLRYKSLVKDLSMHKTVVEQISMQEFFRRIWITDKRFIFKRNINT